MEKIIIRKINSSKIMSNFIFKFNKPINEIDILEISEEYGMNYLLKTFYDEIEEYSLLKDEFESYQKNSHDNCYFTECYIIGGKFGIVFSDNHFKLHYLETWKSPVKNENILLWKYAKATSFIGKINCYDKEQIIEDIENLSMLKFFLKYQVGN